MRFSALDVMVAVGLYEPERERLKSSSERPDLGEASGFGVRGNDLERWERSEDV